MNLILIDKLIWVSPTANTNKECSSHKGEGIVDGKKAKKKRKAVIQEAVSSGRPKYYQS